MRNNATEHEIVRMWRERPDEARQQRCTEGFAYDETWQAGLRLHRDRRNHYEQVMNLIRRLTIE